jgi:hypothetical protein
MLTAVHRLFAEIYMGPRQQEMGIVSPSGRNMFQFCYRTIMKYVDGKMVGDPGPEGVHVDGGTAVMIFVVPNYFLVAIEPEDSESASF